MQLNYHKQQLLESYSLQELALLISEALAIECDRHNADPVLYQMSREFGNLAFKYGDRLNSLSPASQSQP
jgi:hypothetical protein